MSLLTQEYIDSVDGDAHASAVRIIGELEATLRRLPHLPDGTPILPGDRLRHSEYGDVIVAGLDRLCRPLITDDCAMRLNCVAVPDELSAREEQP